MKLDKRALRRLIKEEMTRAVEAARHEETIEETGGYGSARGRAAADDRYEAALEYLRDLMSGGREAVIDAVDALRAGGQAGDTWHGGMNQGSPDARMGEAEEAMMDAEEMMGEAEMDEGCESEEGCEDEEGEEVVTDGEEAMSEATSNEGGEVHREGEELSLTNEMQGHIDNADDDTRIQHVQESFNSRRLGHLAGILED